MKLSKKPLSIVALLSTLTLLAFLLQISLFVINNQVNSLMDALVKSALAEQIFHSVILLPILGFILIQIVSYILLIAGMWFLVTSTQEIFKLTARRTYFLSLFIWLISISAIIALNNYYFSDSFFAMILREYGWYNSTINTILLFSSLFVLTFLTAIAYINYFLNKKHLFLGSLFLFLGGISFLLAFYAHFFTQSNMTAQAVSKPNIIFIGLDSVRPDFTSFFGNQTIRTPHIDSILKSSSVFTEAYTPLARTFPAWMSILTGKYPLHNHARTNLADSRLITNEETLAKRLQKAGYETIYGTDEKRFSNVLPAYGFDQIMGPDMGVNDFLIGGLSDFPLTNLLINTPIGRYLFPYNYGNRAAAITYEPKSFLQLVQLSLSKTRDKPLFLAIHLCVSHWPYTWAKDHEADNFTESSRYAASVQAVDEQLGQLFAILKQDGLLNHTILVVLSDHGTTVGLPHDRIISLESYTGNRSKIKWIPIFNKETPGASYELHTITHPSLDISYGQGTDILSLKQYHIVLAMKGYGITIPTNQIKNRVSLIDIAPTILALLHLPPLQEADGISLSPLIFHRDHSYSNRTLFMETGYRVAGIEEAKISVAKVIHQAASIFEINPKTGLLFVNPELEKGTNALKQRAILQGDWLLARYPTEELQKLVVDKHHPGLMMFQTISVPAYFVLTNIKTGQWTIGLDSKFASSAPTQDLLKQFNNFYGKDL